MKIAYILPSLINKGPIILVNTLVNNIIKLGVDVHVYYFDDDKGVEFQCPTFKIYHGKPLNFDQYDIIHSHMFRPDKYLSKWKKDIVRSRIVSTIHQDIFENLKFDHNYFISVLFTPYWIRKLKKFDRVFVISEKLKSLYSGDISDLKTVYNGVDINISSNKLDKNIVERIQKFKKQGLTVLGTYAAITARKGLDQVVRLLTLRNDLAYVIIGEGSHKAKLKSFASKKGISERILFLPYLTEPYNYCNFFDLYVMSSRSEGFGLALVEAALTKTPIVCSNINVFREIFDDNEVSFFELENIDSLSEATDLAISNGKMASENAYARATEFSGIKMAQNYFNSYIDLLKN